MATISVSLPTDGTTADVADVNTPITTIVNAINGGLDNANIAANAGIDGTKLASVPSTKLSNSNNFSVYRNTAWNQTNGSVKIQFDTEEYDTGSNYDSTTNYRFTTPVAANYHFDAAITIASNSDAQDIQIKIYKNGSAFKNGMLNTTSKNSGTIGSILSLNMSLAANDYVEIYSAWSGTTVAGSTGAAATYFQGYQISGS